VAIGGIAVLVGGLPFGLAAQEKFSLEFPLGLDEDSLIISKDNPLTTSKVELGKLLFFDKRLSQNNTIACASCHKPELAFTDGQPVSMGIHRQLGTRSAPTSINRIFSSKQFWDGRAATLEEQSVGPLVNPVEHGFSDHEEMIRKLRMIKGYQPLFKKAFGTDQITIDRVGKAIASFQRTLLSGNSPYDRFDYGGEENALSQGAQRGLKLFLKKARCTRCHSGFNFTDEKFHNLGIDWDTDHADLGRFKVTGNSEEIGAFKTPTLREIARTAPYMHDGRFATLREVVEFYNRGGIKNPHQDSLVIPLELSEQEKLDLVKFLQALNGEGWQTKPPEKFPM
jgi:cytochrome c peroxidase